MTDPLPLHRPAHLAAWTVALMWWDQQRPQAADRWQTTPDGVPVDTDPGPRAVLAAVAALDWPDLFDVTPADLAEAAAHALAEPAEREHVRRFGRWGAAVGLLDPGAEPLAPAPSLALLRRAGEH